MKYSTFYYSNVYSQSNLERSTRESSCISNLCFVHIDRFLLTRLYVVEQNFVYCKLYPYPYPHTQVLTIPVPVPIPGYGYGPIKISYPYPYPLQKVIPGACIADA